MACLTNDTVQENNATIPVPYGLEVSVSIRLEGDTAFVDVHAPRYTNKNWTMSHCYNASQFTAGQILRDSSFISAMLQHYSGK